MLCVCQQEGEHRGQTASIAPQRIGGLLLWLGGADNGPGGSAFDETLSLMG